VVGPRRLASEAEISIGEHFVTSRSRQTLPSDEPRLRSVHRCR
jgi:hypothetical protein